ncbi:PIN domain-containing protein [Ferrimicrobium acidiphilum]|uniref:PIN domain-containing protein n=1 Tax=Ferrimicrobium acidiphilum TaxID=121039 RepID=UPI00191C5635|nr:PIN domain-containing protein [Ferrimicrobium acidiphilum]
MIRACSLQSCSTNEGAICPAIRSYAASSAQDQWEETQHELPKRAKKIVEHGHLSQAQVDLLLGDVDELFTSRTIEFIPSSAYEEKEELALRRVPQDPKDWAPVALAITMDAGILTRDGDFLGCGLPTWTVETPRLELENL